MLTMGVVLVVLLCETLVGFSRCSSVDDHGGASGADSLKSTRGAILLVETVRFFDGHLFSSMLKSDSIQMSSLVRAMGFRTASVDSKTASLIREAYLLDDGDPRKAELLARIHTRD